MSKKIFCDACGKELSQNFIGEIFGYDSCDKIECKARLILKAKYNYRTVISISMIPSEWQVKEAQKCLKN